jgi:hypothetical protein
MCFSVACKIYQINPFVAGKGDIHTTVREYGKLQAATASDIGGSHTASPSLSKCIMPAIS